MGALSSPYGQTQEYGGYGGSPPSYQERYGEATGEYGYGGQQDPYWARDRYRQDSRMVSRVNKSFADAGITFVFSLMMTLLGKILLRW